MMGKKRIVHSVVHDNTAIAKIIINGQTAQITHQSAGVADWVITIDAPADGRYTASAIGHAGNVQVTSHIIERKP